jgi:hypothetical protein
MCGPRCGDLESLTYFVRTGHVPMLRWNSTILSLKPSEALNITWRLPYRESTSTRRPMVAAWR